MKNEARFSILNGTEQARQSAADKPLHPAWRSFVRYCEHLQHGEINLLKIQDGLPVLAETTRKKVKFSP